jgi:hypothetical protein
VGIIGNLSEVYSSLAFRPENPDAGLAMVRDSTGVERLAV